MNIGLTWHLFTVVRYLMVNKVVYKGNTDEPLPFCVGSRDSYYYYYFHGRNKN